MWPYIHTRRAEGIYFVFARLFNARSDIHLGKVWVRSLVPGSRHSASTCSAPLRYTAALYQQHLNTKTTAVLGLWFF